MTPNTYQILDRTHYVYPGHALVVAYVIMHVFEDAEAALAPSPHGTWCQAVGHHTVPGAGDGAHAGALAIAKLRDGSSPREVVQWARQEWRRRVGPGTGNHEETYEPGQRQADEFEARFLEKVRVWLGKPCSG